ncbi:PAS domain-containing sensor histidine kinase [Paludisphaera rhizosphaerae]|nr:PAS domain-containing sensor histidine kinase [Paludisphaera rhizosphaerae]
MQSDADPDAAFAEALPHIVFTSLPDGRPDRCNKRWRDYVGATSPGDWADRLHPEDRSRRDEWAEATRAGRLFETECRLRDGAGGHRWFLIRAVPRFNAAGAVDSWLTTGTDVDGLVRTREELRRSNAALERFAAIAAHDLQEPVRKVRAFGERIAAGGGIDDRSRGHLGRIIAAAARMHELVHGLLSLARVSGGARVQTHVDLGAIAREVVDDLGATIERSGAHVEVGPLPTIRADAVLMRQLLQNLIANALKFHRPGQVPSVRVSVREAVEDGPAWVLEVADDGIGFDQREASRIFEPFQRLHGRSAYPGSGLGLAICQGVVDRHGGTIAAESVPGVGSVFRVVLPAEPPAEEAVGL